MQLRGQILPAEREKASFDAAALEEIIAGKRPARIQSFTDLFDGAEFDASMDDFESYPDLFAKQLGRAAKAMKIIKDNPSLMIAHQAQKVAMGDFFDTGAPPAAITRHTRWRLLSSLVATDRWGGHRKHEYFKML